MTLAAGTHLGPYEILSLIGAGGMGEVYRARDPRLGREVAIKVLPAQFAADQDRLRRFEQEARAAGMLNHPNILTVYDIGVENDAIYVVTELLNGETLRERISGSPLPSRKSIEYALQIAHGLAAAHDKGIVHRDLKPENVFITRDGRSKILDFGLAKLMDSPVELEARSKVQTVEPGTQPGVVMGTVGYMSPEQVRGRPADHRSDIFSFGTILYEMLTGVKAFHRESVADTMSAILKEDPPEYSQTNRNFPPSLERVVRHCLEKSPEERFQSAHDLAFDLETISGITGTSVTTPAAKTLGSRKILRTVGIIALLIAAVVSAFWIGRRTVTQQAVQTKEPPDFKRMTFRRGYISAARFTPDGQSVVYSASWITDPEELFITRQQSPVSRSVGIPDAALLSISSTGEMAILVKPRFSVGWQRTGTLARVPIDGGAPREILENVQDADWSSDGKQLAVVRAVPGKYLLEFPIGNVLYQTTGWLNNIQVSPQNDAIAFMDHPSGGDDRGYVSIVDLKGQVKQLTQEFASETGLVWAKDGKEIWFTASKEGSNEQPIYGVTRDGKERVIAAMVGNLILHDMHSNGQILLTRDSRRREIVALPPGETNERDLSWFDWSFCRDISDDGKLLLFEEQGAGGGPNYSVYLRKTDGSPAVKLGEGFAATISPDGKSVISYLPSEFTKYTILPTGPGQPKTISIPDFTISGSARTRAQWFADNKRILIPGRKIDRQERWWIQEIDTGKMQPITPEGRWASALISPDQRFVLGPSPAGYSLYPVDGGPSQPVQGLEVGDFVLEWTTDENSIFAARIQNLPMKIEKLDLKTGNRTPWKEIIPPDPTGIAGTLYIVMTPDGKSYAYTYRRVLSDLYLASGIN